MKHVLATALLILIFSCKKPENKVLNANSIIEKAIKTYGGEYALRGIKTKEEVGTTIIYLNDTVFRTSNYSQYFKTSNKSYYESPINKKRFSPKLIFASNDNQFWTQNDSAYAPYLQPKKEIIDRKGEDYPYLLTLEERDIKVQYIEKVTEKTKFYIT